MFPEIQEGAIFISDAHYSERFPFFLFFLQKIDNQAIVAPQLFLMGDMFDLLVGGIEETYRQNSGVIRLINKLSQKMEIFYFEGNHDFNLSTIFPFVKVFPLHNQPESFNLQGLKIALAHGDYAQNSSYKLYSIIIRNRYFLEVMNKLDIWVNQAISKKIITKLAEKKICRKFENFDEFIEKKVSLLIEEYDILIEGHYHQGDTFSFKNIIYYNISAFACNQSYFIVQFFSKEKAGRCVRFN